MKRGSWTGPFWRDGHDGGRMAEQGNCPASRMLAASSPIRRHRVHDGDTDGVHWCSSLGAFGAGAAPPSSCAADPMRWFTSALHTTRSSAA